jgi:hypothetical protein
MDLSAEDTAAIERRQRIAAMLMKQGQEDLPTNETAGGYVVPISPLSGLNKVVQSLAGAYIGKQADNQARDIRQKRLGVLGGLDFSDPVNAANILAKNGMVEEAIKIRQQSAQHAKDHADSFLLGYDSKGNPFRFSKNQGTIGAAVDENGQAYQGGSALYTPQAVALREAAQQGQKGVKVTDDQGREFYAPQAAANPQFTDASKGDFTRIMGGLIGVESGGNPNAISPKGAVGLTQIMPETAANPGYGVQPMANKSIDEQIRFGSDYLRQMIKENGGDVKKGLAAYNGGMGNVDSAETQNYAQNVLKRAGIIKSQSPAEEAAAKAQAELPAKIQEAAAKAQISQQSEIGTTAAKNQLDIQKTQNEKMAGMKYNAEQATPLIDTAMELLPQTVSGGMDKAYNNSMEYLGISTKRSQAQAKLDAIANDLTSKVPKAPGAQSDIELKYAQKQAGDLANADKSWETRLAAAKYLKDRNEKILNGEDVAPPKGQTATGGWSVKVIK